ncbi:prune like [Thalictrum thalictroides]|uniref:Prune like n=1 Tax=Thalictrum thalictroides TaxID=46969 RepID=A0A7J6VE43_THATH|nr:prune like [Thalictrum thalictroides]
MTEKVQQESSYIRNRNHPFFHGILKKSNSSLNDPYRNRTGPSTINKLNSMPSSSKAIMDLESYPSNYDFSSEQSFMDSASNIMLHSPTLSKFTAAPSFSFPTILLDFEVPILPKPTVERTYSVSRRKPSDVIKIPLPPSAASFYSGFSPQIQVVESHESVNRLNWYLKARKDDIRVGVPGKFLHVVIGQEVTDVASVASTIMYAFYLNETLPKSNHFCTVPVINMKREELQSHAEIVWLLDSCHIDQSSLIFINEIDLSYFYEFGSLKLVLINCHRLSPQHEVFKDALVEVFKCKKDEQSVISDYPWIKNVTAGQDSTCCALIAEKISLVSPEILAGQGFSRLLLAGILLDTGNLKNPQCTPKDKYMATLLINGAGRYGCNGLYQILKYKMYDISELKVGDILGKDFKKWARIGKPDPTGMNSKSMVSHIGMSSIGISVEQLLTHDNSATEDIVLFQRSEKLRLLMIVSGYYDNQKNFKREILVSAESADLMRNLLHFFNTNASQLPLKVLHQPGLRDELRAFEIDNKITSRKTIERLLEEFGGGASRRWGDSGTLSQILQYSSDSWDSCNPDLTNLPIKIPGEGKKALLQPYYL